MYYHTGEQTLITVEHDFYGHEVNGIQGVNGKKCYDSAFHLVNKLHDLTENFCYDSCRLSTDLPSAFRKTHARLSSNL